MRGDKIQPAEDKGDQHAEKRGIRMGSEDHHCGCQQSEKTVDQDHLRNRNHLGTVLDRCYRMPDIREDRPEKLGKRRENRARFRNERRECELFLGRLIPDLLFLLFFLFLLIEVHIGG